MACRKPPPARAAATCGFDKIEPSPTGGHNVFIDGTPHYVGTGYAVTVKPGDTVEAGDSISASTPDPAHVIRHKGIGEGRRYWTQAFRDTARAAGMKVNRRNAELLARGLINHVKITDEFNHHDIDDIVPYAAVAHAYHPRDDAKLMSPHEAVGHYLESPVLHYTIGTKVRPSVVRDLQDFSVPKITVHHEPPPFEPVTVRAMSNLAHDPDWMVRMYGSGLKSSFLDSVARGGVSDESGTSFVPGLARAVDFGRTGKVHSPGPGFKAAADPPGQMGSYLSEHGQEAYKPKHDALHPIEQPPHAPDLHTGAMGNPYLQHGGQPGGHAFGQQPGGHPMGQPAMGWQGYRQTYGASSRACANPWIACSAHRPTNFNRTLEQAAAGQARTQAANYAMAPQCRGTAAPALSAALKQRQAPGFQVGPEAAVDSCRGQRRQEAARSRARAFVVDMVDTVFRHPPLTSTTVKICRSKEL